ncbi:DMT family transporter [Bacillus andreraoultii]|uniref:DMT family transporter n=1 Tax=Bacillus andreraoultii TaxID=1499685 RepID=UPI00053B7D38|nr:DMT family transporter [Bacillus andreraoultii]
MNKPKINPYLIIIIGVISVSTSAIFVKLSTAPSGVIAFYRLLFSVLIMLPVFLLKYVKELRNMTKQDFIYSTIAGIFLAFHFILWFESLNYTSVASSTVLVTLQPLFAFIGTYLIYKERISVRTIISAVIAIIGSVMISWGDFYVSQKALIGDIIALIACMLITAYLLIGQSIRKRISMVTYTFIVYFMSTVTLLIYVILKQEPLFPYSTNDWIYFLLLAIFPNLLGHSLFNLALRWISTNIISMAILFEPVGAALLAYILLEEKLTWTQWIGGTIVLSGLLIFSFKKQKQVDESVS